MSLPVACVASSGEPSERERASECLTRDGAVYTHFIFGASVFWFGVRLFRDTLLCLPQVVLRGPGTPQLTRHPHLDRGGPAHAGDLRGVRGRHGAIHLRGLQQPRRGQHLR